MAYMPLAMLPGQPALPMFLGRLSPLESNLSGAERTRRSAIASRLRYTEPQVDESG